MKLIDLNPEWIGHGDDRYGIGVIFNCPKGCAQGRHFLLFENPLDGKPKYVDERQADQKWWHREGLTFDTMSTTPSLRSDPAKGGCGIHIYVTKGEVVPA